jgi:hypothetical protein
MKNDNVKFKSGMHCKFFNFELPFFILIFTFLPIMITL